MHKKRRIFKIEAYIYCEIQENALMGMQRIVSRL